MPPQKKSNVLLWVILGGVFGCCILPIVLLGGLGFWGFNKIKGLAGCMFNYQDMQRALLRYADEHGGKLPNAATWQDDVREDFRKSMTPKQQLGPFEEMSPDGEWGCKDPDGIMSGMAFNSELSGKKISDIRDQVSTIMIFETAHPGKNLNEPYKPKDFMLSPKTIGGKPRGWIEAPVNGAPITIGERGQMVPLRTGAGNNGSGVNVEVNSGPVDVISKPATTTGDTK